MFEFAVSEEQKSAISSDNGVGRHLMDVGERFVQDPTIKKWV